jgi:4a-hydroxytetrahydrobiopterin dehydratase
MAKRPKLKVFTPAAVARRLARELPGWGYEAGFIVRVYETHGWKGTMMAANAVAHLAETAWHHPDLEASYPRLKVKLQTHEAGGITERDFALAKKIEEFVLWRPGAAGGPLEGTPADERYAYLKGDA